MNDRIKNLTVRDEIGNTRVVYRIGYLDKNLRDVDVFVGIDSRGMFFIFRSDSSRVLYKSPNKEFPTLQAAILELFRQMKKEIKLKHKPYGYSRRY